MTHPNSVPVLPRRYFSMNTVAGSGAAYGAQEIAPDPSSPDSWLIAACDELVQVERQLDRLFEVKKVTAAQERRTTALDNKAVSLRLRVVSTRATTLAGHRARAMAFLTMDRGRLLTAANAREPFEGRMLAALICDLLETPRRLLADDQKQADGETIGSTSAEQQASDLEVAIGDAIAQAREVGEHDVADELTVSLKLARSRRLA